MRKNQAAQSIALAFGLAGGLGFLGYTMLGDTLIGDPVRTKQAAPMPSPASEPMKPAKQITVVPATPVVAQAVALANPPSEMPTQSAPADPLSSGAPASPSDRNTGPTHVPAVQAVVAQPTATMAAVAVPRTAPVREVAMVVPPAPVLDESLKSAPDGMNARVADVPIKKQPRRRRDREEHVAAARPAPVTAKPAEIRYMEPAPAPVSKGAPVYVQPIAPAVAEQRPVAAPQANAGFSAKEDMTVTISGQKAWVQVSPTRTMEAKKGDVLPHLGRILEIRGNQVVTEKGTLTTN